MNELEFYIEEETNNTKYLNKQTTKRKKEWMNEIILSKKQKTTGYFSTTNYQWLEKMNNI